MVLKKNNCDIESIAAKFCHDNDENDVESSTIEFEFHSSSDDIPDPSELDILIYNLIVFDDITTDKKQTNDDNYYTRGRSSTCDSLYLSQNYTHLPLHTIRFNSNFMIFFKS